MAGYARVPAGPAISADYCACGQLCLGWNEYLFICMGINTCTRLVLNEYRDVGVQENSAETV